MSKPPMPSTPSVPITTQATIQPKASASLATNPNKKAGPPPSEDQTPRFFVEELVVFSRKPNDDNPYNLTPLLWTSGRTQLQGSEETGAQGTFVVSPLIPQAWSDALRQRVFVKKT
ncbi:hypothetical protein BDY17DRAFT_176983 [Neohortaea acidophila]|uniref:Uncharacterized protein n=1 Tax=Neohortaea acidophila TaxID=245834 RepID=A0A6A6PS88_9PEZI|nr:uncharacterized protein BDY17DRAFT_176983 [Neohortaea acidophila]KAF2482087.1 hypothetical protein BDY17DRAFT_176983 [Neohortaea acidophila]